MGNAKRYDGAGYHAGYVIECALKTLLLVGHGRRQLRGHDLGALGQHAIKLATAGKPADRALHPQSAAAPGLRHPAARLEGDHALPRAG